MTQTDDAGFSERYADLLDEPTDAAMAHLVADLDAVYNEAQPPAALAASIDRAIQAHAIQLDGHAMSHCAEARASAQSQFVFSQPEGAATPMPITRARTLPVAAAAFLVVALLAATFYGLATGRGGTPGSTPTSTPTTATPTTVTAAPPISNLQIQLTVSYNCPLAKPGCVPPQLMASTISVLQQRMIAAFPASHPHVQQSGDLGITVHLSGVRYDRALLNSLFVTGELDFVETPSVIPAGWDLYGGALCSSNCQPGQWPILFTSKQFDPTSISVQTDPQTGQPIVVFAFAGSAREQFAQFTASHIGDVLTVTLDERVIVSTVIHSEIDGSTELTHIASTSQAGAPLASMSEVRALAAIMRSGPFPLEINLVSITW